MPLNRSQFLLPLALLWLLSGCWQNDQGELVGEPAVAPADFSFLGRTSPCYLEVGTDAHSETEGGRRSIRVNCFHVDGRLHIHSNRFAKVPRFRGESWVDTVRREPGVRVAIAEQIYSLVATPLDDEEARVAMLHDRGYRVAWDGITIFAFDSSG